MAVEDEHGLVELGRMVKKDNDYYDDDDDDVFGRTRDDDGALTVRLID